MPSSIIIHWPSVSTVCHPRRFREVAAAAMKMVICQPHNQFSCWRRLKKSHDIGTNSHRLVAERPKDKKESSGGGHAGHGHGGDMDF